ncbi:MAG TPA: transglycosylase SLT domain-containing protein, partial [Saprospiraceae bacterium]|nr:transglycosylase SLT domain-containing protein [Saprospiraceae bacterium]
MKSQWTLTLLLFAAYLFAAPPNENLPTNGDPEADAAAFNFELIKYRLYQMDGIIAVRYADEVESYLRGYLTYGRKDSERLLGNAMIYFPIIEYHLELFNLPDELKYLPVIESSLTPYAVSTSGAAGLWQLREG